MKNLLIITAAAVALLTACGGGGDQAASSGQSDEVAGVKVPAAKLVKGDPDKAVDALKALSLNESGAGRVNFADSSTNGADATFNNVTIDVNDDKSTITSGSLVFKGLDMTDAGASFSQMTLSDLSISPNDDEGALKVASIQLTNPSPALAAWVASLMGEGEPADFPSFDELSFDGFNISGMDLVAEGIDEIDVLKMGAIDIRELSDKGVGSFLFDGFELNGSDDGQPFSVSLDSMGMTGINETVMGVMAASFASGASGEEPDFKDIFALMGASPGDPGYNTLTMDAFVVDAAGLGINMPSLEGKVSRDNQGRATRSTTKPFNITVSADPEGEVGSQLAGPLGLMGYETLNFSMASDVKMNPDADTFSSNAKDNYFALEDGFKLSGGGAFSGLAALYSKFGEEGADPEDPAFMLEALSAMTLENMEISFQDNSILEKAFTLAGAMSGQDAEGMRAQAIAGVAFLPLAAGQAGVDPAIAAELGGALSKFLNESGTLTLKLSPQTPISVGDFSDPSEITKDALGFSATTK